MASREGDREPVDPYFGILEEMRHFESAYWWYVMEHGESPLVRYPRLDPSLLADAVGSADPDED